MKICVRGPINFDLSHPAIRSGANVTSVERPIRDARGKYGGRSGSRRGRGLSEASAQQAWGLWVFSPPLAYALVSLSGCGHLTPGWSAVAPLTYYVAPGGSDGNAGTVDAPFASLAVLDRIGGPGVRVYLREGTYDVTESVRPAVGGARGRPLELFAYPGEHPILDGASMTDPGYWQGWVVDLVDVSWVEIRDIEIANGPGGGLVIRGQSHHNVLRGLNVHDNGRLSDYEGKGISVYGPASFNTLLDNASHNNRDRSGQNADGFQINVSGEGNLLCGNRAWRNSDDGFDFFNNDNERHPASVWVERNYAWENGFGDGGLALGDGIGFKLGGALRNSGSESGGHVVRSNFAWGNRQGAFDENGATDHSISLANRAEPAETLDCPARLVTFYR